MLLPLPFCFLSDLFILYVTFLLILISLEFELLDEAELDLSLGDLFILLFLSDTSAGSSFSLSYFFSSLVDTSFSGTSSTSFFFSIIYSS